MTKPYKRKHKSAGGAFARNKPDYNQIEAMEAAIWDLNRRRARHIARYGEITSEATSVSWIDLPAGTPARNYLDEYIREDVLPDVRTVADPDAANAMWDYIEAHESAGTLPLRIISLRRGISKSELPEEALDLLEEVGLAPKDVIHAFRRYVRPASPEYDEIPGPFWVYEFLLHGDKMFSSLTMDIFEI